ncbi:hypothetical protein JR065_08150 [Xanthomonas sp. AmX2]|uniref:hypothetical protein n=1 Tax=Xanthomonas sp. TaxID=29446 RepID=UPI0019824DF2|nr:hypothetical protein [Xanthomonas sp.]MBN6150308.1 hypothetical protein [Xanthomonas sp.]
MHAKDAKNRKDWSERAGLLALRDLPELPPPKKRPPAHGRNAWLRRVAAWFALVSAMAIARAVWIHAGAGSS